jgi:hypothetical protein
MLTSYERCWNPSLGTWDVKWCVGVECQRRVEVFLYGLFMDEELLCGKGLEPEGGEIAAIDGFALRIGQRAALVPTPGVKVYGLVFSLTRSELNRLYSESTPLSDMNEYQLDGSRPVPQNENLHLKAAANSPQDRQRPSFRASFGLLMR